MKPETLIIVDNCKTILIKLEIITTAIVIVRKKIRRRALHLKLFFNRLNLSFIQAQV